MYQYLLHLAGITVKLQKGALNSVEAHKVIAEVARTYQQEQKDTESSFAPIYTQNAWDCWSCC